MKNIIDVKNIKQQRSASKQFKKPKALSEQEFLEASLNFFKNNALQFRNPANSNMFYPTQVMQDEQKYA